MPFNDRNHYNRLHLNELQQTNQAEIDRLRAAHPDWARGGTPFLDSKEWQNWKTQWDKANQSRQGYEQVQNALESSDGLPRISGTLDDQGQRLRRFHLPTREGEHPDLAKPIVPERAPSFSPRSPTAPSHRSGLPATPLVELLIPTDQTTEQCTAQRPGCLRAALLVHRGARRVAHIDATLVDAALKMMHSNMRTEMITAA